MTILVTIATTLFVGGLLATLGDAEEGPGGCASGLCLLGLLGLIALGFMKLGSVWL
jgi:hypothetical protein